MRLSVGLEGPEDLWADLEQALVKAMVRSSIHA
jgi:cystathionine beta-lyase/cystathionine gamma-synthase